MLQIFSLRLINTRQTCFLWIIKEIRPPLKEKDIPFSSFISCNQ